MAVTEVTNTSWFSRIGKSIVGAGIGLLLAVIAFPVLFWNEGRAVKTAQSLEEGAGMVVTVPADQVAAANEGKLVHLTGTATTTETLSDSEFGISASAIRLMRSVEMYQWDETKSTKTRKKLGGGEEKVTTYDYEKKWSSSVINSRDFKEEGHTNPTRMPYESRTWQAKDVTVGAFHLNESQVAELDRREPLSAQTRTAKGSGRIRTEGDALYIGEDASNAKIGDVRIEFAVVKPGPVSLVARQVGDTFEPYQTKAGDALQLVEEGTLSAPQMFSAAQDANTMMTWLLRGGGWLMMFIGLLMIAKPLSVLGDVVPFIGSIIGMGTGIVAFFVASAASAVTVAFAWIAYRPLLGIALLAVAGGAAFLLMKRAKAKRPTVDAAMRRAA